MQIFAHRGVCQDAPENTMAAYTKALELNVGIEVDVRVSGDGHLICFHDALLNRTTNGRGLVRNFTIAELKQLDAGSWFHPDFAQARIPTLAELLFFVKGKTYLAIEMKFPGTEELIARELEAAGMVEEVVVFDTVDAYSFPRRMKDNNPNISTAVLCTCEEDYESLKRSKFQDVNIIWGWIYSNWLTHEIVDDMQQQGLQVVATTVNAESDMIKHLDLGVDGICTDHPEKFLSYQREKAKRQKG